MISASKTSRPFSYNPPGSKSLANRALILRALSGINTKITNLPESGDVQIMQLALKNISQNIEHIDVGNSGTACRFLCAAATLMNKKIILDGAPAMRRRPIQDLVKALNQLGANISYLKKKSFLPIQIIPGKMHGGTLPISLEKSSQYSSALALIAPFLPGGLTLHLTGKRRSESYLHMTLKLLKIWGIRIEQKNSTKIRIHEGMKPPSRYAVEPDIASSSYMHALAKLHKIICPPQKINKSIQAEKEFFSILKNLTKQTIVDAKNIPDTALTLAVLAPLLKKSITLKNISHLQYKESNRIATLSNELRKIGAILRVTKNTIHITPPKIMTPDAIIETHGDHRIAMAFSLIKSIYPQTTIKNQEVVQKSYPKFWEDFRTFNLSLNKNYVLIGMPGSGKTTLGKALAKKWSADFVDLDDLFEQTHQTTIADFVEQHGWPAFRKSESKLLKKVRPNSRTIISTGGGIIHDPKNRKVLRKLGTIIYLQQPVTALMEHLKGSKRHAHLQKKTRVILKELELQRLTLYKETAHITLRGHDTHEKVQLLEQQLFHHAI